jgi:hypothetical protein
MGSRAFWLVTLCSDGEGRGGQEPLFVSRSSDSEAMPSDRARRSNSSTVDAAFGELRKCRGNTWRRLSRYIREASCHLLHTEGCGMAIPNNT